ncbi:helix-turn-helix domain-containing protein [Salegentibacter sp. HM20]
METSILIEKLTKEELFDGLRMIIKEELEELKKDLPRSLHDEDLLTRNEVASLLKIDLSTVHNWTRKGKLKSLGIGHRVYYKRRDIEEALIPLS